MSIPRLDPASFDAAHRAAHDPPGMWSGFDSYGHQKEVIRYYPRAGLLRGFELSVDYDRVTRKRAPPCASEAEVRAEARRLAWIRYDEAHARTTGDTMDARDFIPPEDRHDEFD